MFSRLLASSDLCETAVEVAILMYMFMRVSFHPLPRVKILLLVLRNGQEH